MASSDLDRYCLRADRLSSGNRVVLLCDGEETYPAMLEAIGGAERSVCLETYILRGDHTGWRFATLLAEKARQGLDVFVLYDGVGGMNLDLDFLDHLRDSGVHVLEYHPVSPSWLDRLNNRDHRKMLVVDSAVAFTGGTNITDDHAPVEEGGGGWHDYNVRLEGPVVREALGLFMGNWNHNAREVEVPEHLLASPEPAGDDRIAVHGTMRWGTRSTVRRAYLKAIRRAVRSVVIANAYFVPDRRILRALKKACRRGVEVSVLLAGQSDLKMVRYASRNLYARLLKWGVRIFEWQEQVLHAKCAVVDGVWSSVGSYNLDYRSFLHNLEMNVMILSRTFASSLEGRLRMDMDRSERISKDGWRRRPRWKKLMERFCYLFRYWL